MFTNAQMDQSGIYDVIVSNGSGTNQSPTVSVKVNSSSGPIFAQEPAPTSIAIYAGGLATVTSVVSGSPPIALQWELDGTNVPGQTAASLVLPNVQSSEAGTYTLFASNTYGTNLSTSCADGPFPRPVRPTSTS